MPKESVEDWAIEKLKKLLALDNETLTILVHGLLDAPDPESTREKFYDWLGRSKAIEQFVEELLARQFPNAVSSEKNTNGGTRSTSKALSSKGASKISGKTSTNSRLRQGSRNKQKQPVPSAYSGSPQVQKANIVQRDDDDLYRVTGKGKKGNNPVGPKESSTSTSTAISSSASTLWDIPEPASAKNSELEAAPKKVQSKSTTSTRGTSHGPGVLTSELGLKTKKSQSKAKQNPKTSQRPVRATKLSDIELAIREIELTQASQQPESRKKCDCQARKHPLNEVAPNCLRCGKIICVMEGIGPCTFCGSPVLSRTQQLELVQALKQEEQREKQMANERRKKKTISSKQGYRPLANQGTHSIFLDPKEFEKSLSEAEKRKQQLLNFDKTMARRTRIIDEAADFDVSQLANDKWASPTERALNLIKMQKAIAAQQKKKKRVLAIDLKGKKVSVRDEEESEGEASSEEDATAYSAVPRVSENDTPKGAMQVHIPRQFARPKFRENTDHPTEGTDKSTKDSTKTETNSSIIPQSLLQRISKKWSIVQDEFDDVSAITA